MDIKQYFLSFYIAQNGEVVTPELAKMLVEDFAITDGSGRINGEKWTPEEAMEIGKKLEIDYEEIPKFEWYLILNMMYSDYNNVAIHFGITDALFYGEMALAWFHDVDARENKTFKFFFE